MASMPPKHFITVFTFLLCIAAIGVFFGEPEFSQDFFQQRDKSACDCGKCLSKNDTWFLRRFNESVEVFLSEGSNLSAASFYWWKYLQTEPRGFTTFSETVKFLFRIFPPNPQVLERTPEQCRTCAVVGNSVNLKGSGYGRLIDGHDVIIRINRGKTLGYEADVGNRTTHRVMYPESSVDLDDTTHLILFPFKLKDLEWLIRIFTVRHIGAKWSPKDVLFKINGNRDLVSVLNPVFMKYVHESWLNKKGRYPSTGFLTLILALHVCDEVNVFGYGADKDGNWEHYWEKLKIKSYKTGIHPGTYEYDAIQKLASKHKISFYPGR
ncbi:CMP-N-acetylneuraminate-beta-galactosamide-alpha-2,3-sialyltransferase 1-like [Betta splendens]|uniref:CMP-N-acetylneuraminate-beta-galactosamide-alpha-2,3-sialyltransferase 1 n=1 Tax=Betta splendens TaxID=158456 RepID=A0A6P7NZ75_BETSP|nr:CMP-N-acetylneuraminate-beta-galactosamide-alpha-2,3-sialyltransferase 1-like [Betta splendens]XP_055368930.1 CMP-N-acetylneuraminate-beta-galactosamide-alpha-2,3-sialyltransferase 1-like [Betta splendens]